jgi:hypothetical protein
MPSEGKKAAGLSVVALTPPLSRVHDIAQEALLHLVMLERGTPLVIQFQFLASCFTLTDKLNVALSISGTSSFGGGRRRSTRI